MTEPVALVTGAARGIGAATVDALVADGWMVVATDACGTGAPVDYPQPTVAELETVVARHGTRAQSMVVDVRDRNALDAAVAETLERHGRVDAVVAAAGIVAGGVPMWQMTESDWAAVVDTDLTGVWNTISAAVPAIVDSPDRAGWWRWHQLPARSAFHSWAPTRRRSTGWSA